MGGGRRVWEFLDNVKPVILMVIMQIGLTGVSIFYKLAGNAAFSIPILIAYRFQFATATVIPLAFIFEWEKRPKLTREVLLLSFFGAFFGMENLRLKTWGGRAKVMGTCLCVGGAMLLTFYKGYEFKFSTPFDLTAKGQHSHQHQQQQHKPNSNILGFSLAILFCLSTSLGLIMQAKVGKVFPYSYTSTALITVMGTFQTTIYALCKERDKSKWRIGWNIKLLASAYMGIVGSGLMWVIMMYCVQVRGPLFISVFSPLMLVLVAIAGALMFPDEKLYLGSVLGAVVIIIGLYTVLWGKGKEIKKLSQLVPSSRSYKSQGSQEGGGAIARGSAASHESFKGFNDSGHAIIAVPPHIDCEEEEGEDIEDQIRSPQAKA